MSEHVILVAFTVEAVDRFTAHGLLMDQLEFVKEGPAYVESWWVAEDDRRDRSDNDSAVFCDKGYQRAAHSLLLAGELTAAHNAPQH